MDALAALGVPDELKAVTFTTLTGSLTKTDGEYGLSARRPRAR